MVDENNDYLITQNELKDFIFYRWDSYRDIVLDTDVAMMQQLLDTSEDEYCSYDRFAYNPNKIRYFKDEDGESLFYDLVN